MSDAQQNWLLAISGLVISSLLAYLLFARQLRDPRPAYVVTGNLVVEGIEADDIDIFHDGQPVPRVTRTLVALWNSGRGSVRHEDVRQPITFTVQDEQVLRVNIVASTRDEIGMDCSTPAKDSVEISFSHLDHLDGVCLEILHTGSDPLAVTTSGVIVGVKKGLKLVQSPLYRDDAGLRVAGIGAIASLFLGIDAATKGDYLWMGIGFGLTLVSILLLAGYWRLHPRSLPPRLRELDLPRAPRYQVNPIKGMWIGLRGWF